MYQDLVNWGMAVVLPAVLLHGIYSSFGVTF